MKSNFTVNKPSEKKFGLFFSFIFLMIFLYFVIIKNSLNYYLLIISFIFLILSLFIPKYLKILNICWFKLGFLLGFFISPIIMALVYYITFVPMGLIIKFFNIDLLKLKIDKEDHTYWDIYKNENQSMKNLF